MQKEIKINTMEAAVFKIALICIFINMCYLLSGWF
jgi:hypothetical protein